MKFSSGSSHAIYYFFFLATLPQGVLLGLLVLVLPPLGCDTGFIATPLTVGLTPNRLFFPADPITCLFWLMFDTRPRDAVHLLETQIIFFDGNFILDMFVLVLCVTITQNVPAARAAEPAPVGVRLKL